MTALSRTVSRLVLIFFLSFSFGLNVIARSQEVINLAQETQQNIVNNLVNLLKAITPLIQKGEFEEAIAIAEKALKFAEQNFGSNSIEVATSLSYLAQANSSMGNMDDALTYYEKAIKIFQSTPNLLDTEKILFANALSGLAIIYVKSENYKKAEQVILESLELYEGALGQYHPSLAPFLESLAQIYLIQKRFDLAENYYKKVLEINEKNYGINNKIVVNTKIRIANLYIYQGLLDEALATLNEALEIEKNFSGEENPEFAVILNNIAKVYGDKALYKDAEKFYKRALDINKKTLGPKHSQVGINLNNLAEVYGHQGKYNIAEPIYKEALEIFKTSKDIHSNDVAICLNNLGLLYATLGRFDEAESHIKRAMEIQQTIFGAENLQLANTLNNLAFIYRKQGRFDEAESLLKKSLDIRKSYVGEDNLDVALSFNNLAELYHNLGRYEEATIMFKRALEIREKLLGREHPDVAITLNNLAAVYRDTGNYVDSEILFKRSLEIREKVLGQDHPDVALGLNNLAALYWEQKLFDQSISNYERALRITETKYGKDHPDVALYLSNLGAVYTDLGQFDQAESLFRRAQKIYDKEPNKMHPESINNLLGMAKLFLVQQRYGDAEKIYLRALEKSKKIYGDKNPSVALPLNALGKLHVYQGNFETAFSYFKQGLEILNFTDFDYTDPYSFPVIPFTANILFNQLYILNKLSENNPARIQEAFDLANFNLAFLELFRGKIESQESKLIQWGIESEFFELALFLTAMMREKQGILPEESYLFLEAGLSRNFSEEISERYLKTEKNIPKQILERENLFLQNRKFFQSKLIEADETDKLRKVKRDYVESEKSYSDFIDSLHEKYPAYAQLNYPRPVALNLVQDKLLVPGRVALAYYLGIEQSFVLVLTNDRMDLKTLNVTKVEIQKEIEQLRQAILWYEEQENPCDISVKPISNIQKDIEQFNLISQELYRQLIQPISNYLTDQKEIIIIPHSNLWLLPFEILMEPNSKLLGTQFLISYQNSFTVWNLSHDFLEEKTKNPSVFVGIGDAIYQNDDRYKDPEGEQLVKRVFNNEIKGTEEAYYQPELIHAISRRSQAVNKSFKGCSWEALEESKEEIRLVRSLPTFKNASDSRLGYYAAEWNLNGLDNYRYVHFSVHGSMRMQVNGQSTQPALILTQKNPPDSNVDGILTMEEVMNKIRLNADLVVLSACDTGLGDMQGGEGVMSMTRAFQYAGSGAVLTSLWKVHEDATKEFMVQIYSYLDEGKQPKEALFLTKKDFQQKKIKSSKPLIDYSHPFFWAAFVLVGGD